jgi:hypothetical protein
MAHFARKLALRTRRTDKYDSLTMLGFQTNCTHVHEPLPIYKEVKE